mgnify:CR=1 FL=1
MIPCSVIEACCEGICAQPKSTTAFSAPLGVSQAPMPDSSPGTFFRSVLSPANLRPECIAGDAVEQRPKRRVPAFIVVGDIDNLYIYLLLNIIVQVPTSGPKASEEAQLTMEMVSLWIILAMFMLQARLWVQLILTRLPQRRT